MMNATRLPVAFSTKSRLFSLRHVENVSDVSVSTALGRCSRSSQHQVPIQLKPGPHQERPDAWHESVAAIQSNAEHPTDGPHPHSSAIQIIWVAAV